MSNLPAWRSRQALLAGIALVFVAAIGWRLGGAGVEALITSEQDRPSERPTSQPVSALSLVAQLAKNGEEADAAGPSALAAALIINF